MLLYLLSAVGYSVYEPGSPDALTTVAFTSPESLKTLAAIQGSKVFYLDSTLVSGARLQLATGQAVLLIALASGSIPEGWE
jgi:hypothetical protein